MFKVTVSYCFSSQDTSLFLLEESTFPELPTLIKVQPGSISLERVTKEEEWRPYGVSAVGNITVGEVCCDLEECFHFPKICVHTIKGSHHN